MNCPPSTGEPGHPSAGGPKLHTRLLDVADLAIVFCRGRITGEEDIDTLRQVVTTKLAKVNVVLDFSEVEAIDAGKFAVLISVLHAADPEGTHLAIFNPSLAFYLELRRIRSQYRIAILSDAEFLWLLRQGKALKARPSARAARHWGQRLSHALRTSLDETATPGLDWLYPKGGRTLAEGLSE